MYFMWHQKYVFNKLEFVKTSDNILNNRGLHTTTCKMHWPLEGGFYENIEFKF